MEYTLNINGESKTVDVEPGTPLLWVIRDHLQLTGTKFGCGVAACGACTVHLNGSPTRACVMPIDAIGDSSVTTIEGLSDNADKISSAVQSAWKDKDVVQCGYCQSGQIMSAVGLLQQNKAPTDTDIDRYMAGNVCRCATYTRIKSAIHTAAEALATDAMATDATATEAMEG